MFDAMWLSECGQKHTGMRRCTCWVVVQWPCAWRAEDTTKRKIAHSPFPQGESQSTRSRSARSSSPTNATAQHTSRHSTGTQPDCLFSVSAQSKSRWNGLAASLPPPLQQPQFQQHQMQSTLLRHRQGQTPRTTSQRARSNSFSRPSACAPMPRMWPIAWPFGAS